MTSADQSNHAPYDAPDTQDAKEATPEEAATHAHMPISGRYSYHTTNKRISLILRVDVDEPFPQQTLSLSIVRRFPTSQSHIIAKVINDSLTTAKQRRLVAEVWYRKGNPQLLAGQVLVFTASTARKDAHSRRESEDEQGTVYADYVLEVKGHGLRPQLYALTFQSRYFERVVLELDRVEDAGTIVRSIRSDAHPQRPDDLQPEELSLSTIYNRAGFDVHIEEHSSIIPIAEAGVDGVWSDAELHNAMAEYWSRYASRPQWAMWVLYAARHRDPQLGGVMFDDIGPYQRQGTAIFTKSFIGRAPEDDAQPEAWQARMQFWTAVHEIGHGFNLVHSWQKRSDSWIALSNDRETRSFMNYPYRVRGGEAAFFRDFYFRFSDEELLFMRHAPRRFVEMGNSDWGVDHAFEEPQQLLALMQAESDWQLSIRTNRGSESYRFLEPVTIELKLANRAQTSRNVDKHLLDNGHHLTVFVARHQGATKRWRPMQLRCSYRLQQVKLEPNEGLYASHTISVGSRGWLIDEPGFYKVQVGLEYQGDIILSNVLRLYVAPPSDWEESALAPDYFSEAVGRVLAFDGAPSLSQANSVLRELIARCPQHPASKHAEVALSAPKLHDFKVLQGDDTQALVIRALPARVEQAVQAQVPALLADPHQAANTLGHIPYFHYLRQLAEAMEEDGNKEGAIRVMEKSIDVMKQRHILGSVVHNAQRRLERRKA